MEIVIAAAGLGSRLQSPIPKPLYPVGGIPNLQRLIEVCMLTESPVTIVLGHKAKEIQGWICDFGAESYVSTVYNPLYLTEPPMTSYKMGAHKAVTNSNNNDENIVILCADLVIRPESLASFLEIAKHDELAGVSYVRSLSGLTTKIENNMIVQITESTFGTYEWGNFLSIKAKTLLNSREPLLSSLVSKLLPFPAFITSCIDIDTPDDVFIAENLIL